MALWKKGEPKETGDYIVLLEDGNTEHVHFFKCQMTGQKEWSRIDGSYVYENIVGWIPYDGS